MLQGARALGFGFVAVLSMGACDDETLTAPASLTTAEVAALLDAMTSFPEPEAFLGDVLIGENAVVFACPFGGELLFFLDLAGAELETTGDTIRMALPMAREYASCMLSGLGINFTLGGRLSTELAITMIGSVDNIEEALLTRTETTVTGTLEWTARGKTGQCDADLVDSAVSHPDGWVYVTSGTLCGVHIEHQRG